MIPTYNYSIHMYSWVVSQPTFTSRLGAPHCSFIKLVFSVRKKNNLVGWEIPEQNECFEGTIMNDGFPIAMFEYR